MSEELNNIKRGFSEITSEVSGLLREASVFKPRFYHAIKSKSLKRFSGQVDSLRSDLMGLDERFHNHINVPRNVSSAKFLSAQVSIVSSFRDMALTSLDEASKMIASHEAQSSFKLTVVLSFSAILVSVAGVISAG